MVFYANGGFLFDRVAWYAVKEVMKIAAIVIGLFVVGLSYLKAILSRTLNCPDYRQTLVAESLREEKTGGGKSPQGISNQILVIEDRLGLYFGPLYHRTIYPSDSKK